MATVRLRNTNPLGYVDLPLIGRQAGARDVPGDHPFETEGISCLVPGEVFEVDAELAAGLLEQVGNYELVNDFPDGEPAESWQKGQLEAYAAAHLVDLTGATTKAEILAAIKKGGE